MLSPTQETLTSRTSPAPFPQNLTINLGDFPVSDFISVGMLSSPAQNFDVTVNCNSNVQPEVKVTSSNGYEPGSAGVIKLTRQPGMATGVGVRMLVDNQLATFDTYVNTQSRNRQPDAGDPV